MGDAFFNNTCCLIGASGASGRVGGVSQCDPAEMEMHANRYYLENATGAAMGCGRGLTPISRLYAERKVGKGSTAAALPSDEEMVDWAKRRLF